MSVSVKRASVKFAKVNPRAPLIVLTAKVNGRGRFRFLLDTGASHSCVTPHVVSKLKLSDHGKAEALGAGGEMSLALTKIESLSVGAAEVRNLTVAVVDVSHVTKLTKRLDGVVGNDFMRKFRVTIDYKKSRVSFE